MQSIGVFYVITVGLIAVGSGTRIRVRLIGSKEAASIGALYRDIGGYPAPVRDELRAALLEYTRFLIEQSWPAQKEGRLLDGSTRILDDFQSILFGFEPATAGQTALHGETLRAYNTLIEYRRLRLDAVGGGLPGVMWGVIWWGRAIQHRRGLSVQDEDPSNTRQSGRHDAGFWPSSSSKIVMNDSLSMATTDPARSFPTDTRQIDNLSR